MGWKGGKVDVYPGSFFSFFLFFTMVNSWEFSVFCFMRIFILFFVLFSYNSFHSADRLQSQNNWLTDCRCQIIIFIYKGFLLYKNLFAMWAPYKCIVWVLTIGANWVIKNRTRYRRKMRCSQSELCIGSLSLKALPPTQFLKNSIKLLFISVKMACSHGQVSSRSHQSIF